ncbi:electron transport complex subunit RsxC [Candidatus Nitrosacidococcus tergens]|uniref:Ion-translocating oxidoreductase complex subunit C n=1 Tax=Candidatus Nitrosacidococcus tergens TaxID=553981 RepID=A0A7G1Q9P1_9GAMM|nr:electron transport complex subunit RsxC [Candidatus Nitrosacidococcus tergens]CAB1275771.1 Electron transport complex protein RnfC [Candidatus Nitrosacidococcus tergens]
MTIPALWSFFGGIKLPSFKEQTAKVPIIQSTLPQYLTISLSQYKNQSADPLVVVGESVLKGQIIAQPQGKDGIPIHASSSGKVVNIKPFPILHQAGVYTPCIQIETNGEDRWIDLQQTKDPYQKNSEQLCQLIEQAGISGLGGAGFPTHRKLTPNVPIDTLILNGAECEPYICCDDALMQERASEIFEGLNIMAYILKAQQCIIGIEDNKPKAYHVLKSIAPPEIKIVKVPNYYPAGGERQLIKTLTGKEVPSGKLPQDIGVICHSVSTAVAVYQAIFKGKPLISRIVTITGTGITQPQNIEVRLGTPISHILNQCKVNLTKINRLVIGGPMMGFTIDDINLPITKTTQCIIVGIPEQKQLPELPCIRCGACVEVCPSQLLPQQLYWYAKAQDLTKAQEYHLFDCIECGNCAYVCPSHIPLVQYYRQAKNEVYLQVQEKAAAEDAKARYEFRQQRLIREQQEWQVRQQAKKIATSTEDKKAAIQAAIERAKAKKKDSS